MPVVVRTDPASDGEMALRPDWVSQMVAARKAKAMTQQQLADAVGCSQGMISQIEKGVAGSSALVMRIADTLGIGPPVFVKDDLLREWYDVGAELRRRDPAMFTSLLGLARQTLERLDPTTERH